MTMGDKILGKACELFDVVGATVLPGGYNLLILGLESTTERNLDEFGRKSGKFMLYGFKKHAAPKLEALVTFIRSKGFSAETVKRYGYPLKGEINLKSEAIRAGLGKRGKSTVVLHPRYGPRLRFMAVRTTASFEFAATSELTETNNSVCQGCSICLDVCPTQVLEPYCMTNPSLCLSNITPQTEDGRSILCDKCLILCPGGKKN